MMACRMKQLSLASAVVLAVIAALAASTPSIAEPARSDSVRVATNLDVPGDQRVTVKRRIAHRTAQVTRKIRFAHRPLPNTLTVASVPYFDRGNWCADRLCGASFALMIGIGY